MSSARVDEGSLPNEIDLLVVHCSTVAVSLVSRSEESVSARSLATEVTVVASKPLVVEGTAVDAPSAAPSTLASPVPFSLFASPAPSPTASTASAPTSSSASIPFLQIGRAHV